MFRFFQSENSSSWFSMPALLKTAWMNPFGRTSSFSLNAVLLRAMLLMQSFQIARAQTKLEDLPIADSICFYEKAPVAVTPKYGLNVLNVGGSVDDAFSVLTGELTHADIVLGLIELEVDVAGCRGNSFVVGACQYLSGARYNSIDLDLGPYSEEIMMGGTKFIYMWDWSMTVSDTPTECVIDTIQKNNDLFLQGALTPAARPTPDDIAAIVIASGSGLILSCYAFCIASCMVRNRNRRLRLAAATQRLAAATQQAELATSAVDNADDAWWDLSNRLAALSLLDDEDKALKACVKELYQKYLCGINRAVMADPVSLSCRHNFEKTALEVYIASEEAAGRETKCPCCRVLIDKSEVVTNEVMKEAIVNTLAILTRNLDKLVNRGANLSAAESSVSSNSSSDASLSAVSMSDFLLSESPLSLLSSSSTSSLRSGDELSDGAERRPSNVNSV